MDCLSGLTVSLNKKERAQEESREKFDEQITQSFKQLQDSQRQHIHSVAVQEKHVKSNISRQWKLLKRTLMSERSPWASRWDGVISCQVTVPFSLETSLLSKPRKSQIYFVLSRFVYRHLHKKLKN